MDHLPSVEEDVWCVLITASGLHSHLYLVGDVIYIKKLANPIIILNSLDAIRDLFEKRSGSYSSRPTRTMMQL